MSFKYRFILSFVLLEVFFILLIVTINFQAITNSSNKLIAQRVDSNITFMKQLLKVPLSIYDIATLDNMVHNSVDLGYVNSLIILDSKERILSKAYNYKLEAIDELMKSKTDTVVYKDNSSYEIRYEEMYEEETFIGSFYIIFDTSENSIFIQENRMKTIMIIFVEILLSTILSYIIGSKLTQMLTRLSEVAKEIGDDKQIEVPYLDKKDEIGILSNSMNQMQGDLNERTNKLKELAAELNKQRNELILANKAKDDFLANMSHELKTPLNSINVISSVMMKNKQNRLNENEVKNLSIINSCGNDLLYLINDVLDISKLEAGEIEVHYETILLKDLMLNISTMFEPQIQQKGLDFQFIYDESIQYIHTDIQRTKQIVKNLLSNALKFTSSGSIELKVLNLSSKVQISVKDDGIGIEKDKLEHVFDRFKQADSSTTRKFGGTGLGLAISSELAKLLGGTLEVESEINNGATFILTIPKNEHKVVKIKETLKEEENTDSSEVIVLNDNPIALMNFIIGLTKDFTVIQVNNLDELTTKVKKSSFKHVIINVNSSNKDSLKSFVNIHDLPYVFIYEENLEKEFKEKAKHAFVNSMHMDAIINELKD